ncbi:MAG: ABC transporter ATP-binding protein [Anaerolineae bacterium]|nr:ABC transporter ATP-binding protein [Anaerolineae bacterium]
MTRSWGTEWAVVAKGNATEKTTSREPRRRSGGGPMGHLRGRKERAHDIQGTLLRIWDYLKRQEGALAITTLLVIVSSGLGTLGPYLMGRTIDEYIDTGDLAGLAGMALLMLAVYVSEALVSWLQTYVMAQASQQAVNDIRDDLFAKLQTLSLRFFDQRTHGELMSRLTNDVENISNVLTSGVSGLISNLLSLVGVAAMMLLLNVRLAIVTLITVPLMVMLSRWIAQRTRSGFRQQQAFLGDLNGIIEETVTGARVVKAYSREPNVVAAFREVNRKLRKASTRAEVFAGTLPPITNLVNNTGLTIVAGVGGWMAVRGLATVGDIASFVQYARRFGWPLNGIASLYNTIQSAIAGAERVFAILDEVPDVADAAGAQPLGAVKGDVTFEDVCFAYAAGVPVLKHVSLHAEAGQSIALVGPTGAGKTTIVNLLTRFYDVGSGRILIDGIDIRDVQVHDLRRKLGIVLQDTYLFADTVMENIRYGRLDATDEEVVAAAVIANADPFIRHLPHGYATPLSERGSNLSQGQRQLLAIARAVLADPSILVLDEATSSIDTRTERTIQEAMLRLMEGRTSFVIAHRLSTIREADQIVVINDGETIERGTHCELLARKGFYHDLYLAQFKGHLDLVPELVSD